MSEVHVRRLADGRYAAVVIFDDDGLQAMNYWGVQGTATCMPENTSAATHIARLLDEVDFQLDILKEEDDEYDGERDECPF